jgi:hypothetical protein
MLRNRRVSRKEMASATSRHEEPELTPDFYTRKLKEAFGAGIEALDDRDVEAQVIAHFRANPHLCRDARQVAAVACQFKRQKILETRKARLGCTV